MEGKEHMHGEAKVEDSVVVVLTKGACVLSHMLVAGGNLKRANWSNN